MTNNQKIILESLSMDLLRASLGRYRGSHKMAERFITESERWIAELKDFRNKDILQQIRQCLSRNDNRQAEDLLMYSTLIRNRSVSNV
ncbi:MAG: hypothetical protein WAV40_01175 [Microgenomates group bacterium]